MTIAVGTEKGAYLLDEAGSTWNVRGPLLPGWKVTAFGRAPDGAHLAAVGSNWFGAAIYRSSDLDHWDQVEGGPSFGEQRPLTEVWTFHTSGDLLYAGVQEAGLFTSPDGGSSWEPVPGLNDHPTREEWMPGLGGLCAHRVLTSGQNVWVAISAVGVFRSDDGGATFTTKNEGIESATGQPEAEVGYCVHGLVAHPSDPSIIWRQDHKGMFRTENGGDHWDRIESGLPSGYGFAIARDDASGRLFCVPLHSDENRVPVDGRLAAHLSEDGGESWRVAGRGWPEAPQYTAVLRGAIAADGEGTVCFGTTGGNVWLTRDAGDTWLELPPSFPRIDAVALV